MCTILHNCQLWHFVHPAQKSGGVQPAISSTQQSPFERLQGKFSTIIDTLSRTARAEDLADKLFTVHMINLSHLQEAGVTTVENSKRIRPLVVSVLQQVNNNPEKFIDFIEILRELGQQDLVTIIQS